MAAIDPHVLELKEAVARHTERLQYVETQLTALEKASSWWRQFTSTALPIMVTIIVAVWVAIATQSGHFAEVSKRIDDTNKRIEETNRRIDRLEDRVTTELRDLRQDVKQILKQTARR